MIAQYSTKVICPILFGDDSKAQIYLGLIVFSFIDIFQFIKASTMSTIAHINSW